MGTPIRIEQQQIAVDDPIRSNWNRKRAERAAQEICRKGVPRWASHPHEFKNWAMECYLKDKEQSEGQVIEYRMEEQETFTDHKARMHRRMGTREFVEKLRNNGVHCFTYQVPPGPGTPKEMLNTVGLWAEVPTERGVGHEYQGRNHQYICYMDIPSMFEWSILRLDDHDLPIGEAYRGWRTVLSQLIQKRVLTEWQAHAIFGEPAGATSKVYRKTLHKFRNGRIKQNDRSIQA